MTELKALLERVEKASGRDNDLAYDICAALGYSSPPIPARDYKGDITGSIDAALALANWRLPGICFRGGAGQVLGQKTATAELLWYFTEPAVGRGEAPTLPIAILAALLSTLVIQEQANDR